MHPIYKYVFGLVFIYLQFAKDYIYLKAFCLINMYLYMLIQVNPSYSD